MDKPKCKLCGERHSLGRCPSLMVEPSIALPDTRKAVKIGSVAAETVQTKFDRATYQREYMRKRRAMAKLTGDQATDFDALIAAHPGAPISAVYQMRHASQAVDILKELFAVPGADKSVIGQTDAWKRAKDLVEALSRLSSR